MPRADSNAAQAGSNAAQAGSNAAVADGNAARADGNAANEGSEHEHPVDQDVQEVADRVEAVALDAQAQEVGSDYIPSTFLGLGM